jgi:hypothetical protein
MQETVPLRAPADAGPVLTGVGTSAGPRARLRPPWTVYSVAAEPYGRGRGGAAAAVAGRHPQGGQKMRLRGSFDPKVQVLYACVGVAAAALVALSVAGWAEPPARIPWAYTDLLVAPFGLAAGLWTGIRIGRRRLELLRRVLPEVEGKFYLGLYSVFMRSREGEIVVRLQAATWGFPFLAALVVTTYTEGRVEFWASAATFMLGASLTGKTVPFVRLWLELRKAERAPRSA